MGAIHALIGIGEGLITVGALALLLATRPDLVSAGESQQKSGLAVWLAGLGIVLLLAIASPFASANPDGLEWVAEQKGFLDTAQDPLYNIIPDYVLPGVSNEALATILAGVIGSLIVFGVTLAVAYNRRSHPPAATRPDDAKFKNLSKISAMHIHFLDPYQERNSLIHRLDARVKFVLTLVFILTVALTPHGAWPVYIILFSLVLAVEVISEIGVGYVLKRASLALPFVMAAFPVIFTLEGPVLARLPLGPWVLTIYQPGLERFISIALKVLDIRTSRHYPGNQHTLSEAAQQRCAPCEFRAFW